MRALLLLPAKHVVFTIFSARGLRDADAFSTSDPYVVVKHGAAPAQRTRTIRNSVRNPTWREKLRVELDRSAAESGNNNKSNSRVSIEVLDNDGGKGRDDPLGRVDIPLRTLFRNVSQPLRREAVSLFLSRALLYHACLLA